MSQVEGMVKAFGGVEERESRLHGIKVWESQLEARLLLSGGQSHAALHQVVDAPVFPSIYICACRTSTQ